MPKQRSTSTSNLGSNQSLLLDWSQTTPTTLNTPQKLIAASSEPYLKSGDVITTKKESQSVAESNSQIKRKLKKKRRFALCANLTLTRYNLVKKVCSEHGFNITDQPSNECMLIWSDTAVPIERIAEMKSYQKINHFVGMGEICRKDLLARNMGKVTKLCPSDFNFVPQTWVLPGEYAMLQFYVRENKKKRGKTYIRKPVNGAMGHGIWLTRNVDKIQAKESCIIQEYLDKPLLMDGYKFDLRLYVLVLSCDPLKIFLYKDGLVRMGTEPYTPPNDLNVRNSFMHLTNYSINKHSENFIPTSDTEMGSKRTLKFFWEWLQENSGDPDTVWNNIKDVVIKTILVVTPHLFHAYHMCRGSDPGCSSCCFEVLGFDIFLDRSYKPWVLEVNRAPSFGTDQELDHEIKHGVLNTTLKLLDIKASDKKKMLKAEKMQAHKRLFDNLSRRSVDISNVIGDRREILQKRKKDLKWRLCQLRDETKRKEYEDRNCGDFACIYPPDSPSSLQHYNTLLQQCTKAVTGRTILRKEHSVYFNMKEEQILDLLEEVENEVLHSVDKNGQLILRGPPPLTSMPPSTPKKRINTAQSMDRLPWRPASSRVSRTPLIGRTGTTSRTGMQRGGNRPTRCFPCKSQVGMFEEDRNEKTGETLRMLLDMKIKFPGKTDEEASVLLAKLQQDWECHRLCVASYWMVKLDSIKRRKVIDIVKGNVTTILRRVWKISDMESLPLHRIFTKLFDRLLWSHGQGLWNFFNTTKESWDTVFPKYFQKFTQTELQCCRQVVQLCCNCLLVVYQFSTESSRGVVRSVQSERCFKIPTASLPSSTISPSHSLYFSRSDCQSTATTVRAKSAKPQKHHTGVAMGSKIVKLYK